MSSQEGPITQAWVNWNPDPLLHAYGTTMKGRGVVIGLCRITVREQVGTFDPDGKKVCALCAEFVRSGLTWDDVKDRRTPIPANAIVCVKDWR